MMISIPNVKKEAAVNKGGGAEGPGATVICSMQDCMKQKRMTSCVLLRKSPVMTSLKLCLISFVKTLPYQ